MKIKDYILALLYILSILLLAVFADQNSFELSLVSYSVSFLLFFLLWSRRQKISMKNFEVIMILSVAIILPVLPNMSPDYFRFLWDGNLVLDGVNPFAYKPNDIIDKDFISNSTYYQELYAGLTDLSKENYSCYPSINQFYFVVSNLFSDNVVVNLLVMRLLIASTMALGYIYCLKLLRHFKLSIKQSLLFYLNPFIFLELILNLHFEGVMLSFLIIAFYFLVKKKLVLSALLFAIAINVKLTPILLLPFLYKSLDVKNTLKYYSFCAIFLLLISFTLLWPQYIANFVQSLGLYFANFEFNSSIYILLYKSMYPYFTWETVYIVGPALSLISLGVIMIMALKREKADHLVMLHFMMMAYSIYLFLSPTVHPWYLSIPLLLSVFTKRRYMLFWSFSIILSYALYASDVNVSRWMILAAEYVLVLYFFVYEMVTKKEKSI